jgi:hypothetical protein
MSDPFDMRTRIPKTGSVAASELPSLQFDKTREASGIDAGMQRKPEAIEGRDYAIDDYTVEKQDEAKQTPDDGPDDRRSPYNHPHIGGRGGW